VSKGTTVKLSDVLDQLPADVIGRRVYGEPYQTADGATVIPVARVRIGRRMRRADSDPDLGAFGFAAVPVGVFVVHGGKASWVPAVDVTRIGMIGVTTGLLAAVISSLAVLRQPPWPRITITDYR
jgi:hypothetical protein